MLPHMQELAKAYEGFLAGQVPENEVVIHLATLRENVLEKFKKRALKNEGPKILDIFPYLCDN